MIHIYCGDGKGKTTASVGLAVRVLGSGKKVLYTQFFKSGNSCEIKLLKTLDNLTYRKAEQHFGFYKDMDDKTKELARQYFSSLLEDIIEIAEEFDLVVFDEIISTYNYNMIDKDKLKTFLTSTCVEVVLTGRNPSAELVEIADYVSEIKKIKHPYDKGISARYGIEF
ncbi:MAG: cob(I)yrinic acid a,c-diamide adenosyltransferase [Epulopiscium sp. Nuni2H_MBin003]|nr:MAG: cob(I)yrinic acid a,c-diamide adenosyltransferase [Epulopiscium sp. Nuni2H_MBin003]